MPTLLEEDNQELAPYLLGEGRKVSLGRTDAVGYLRADSGCPEATEKLGYRSSCLENCPFEDCIYMRKSARAK